MKGRHDTQLVYVHDGGVLDVGVVACVPRIGEEVTLPSSGVFVVTLVTWHVGLDPIGAFAPATSTMVRAQLLKRT